MNLTKLNAADVIAPAAGYSQAVSVEGAKRLLFVSGQIPVAKDGTLPTSFADQARLAWRNVEAQLRAAGMGLDNLVKATVFLSDRKYAMESRQIRAEILGDRAPAMTVVIVDIFDSAWLLEIEAIAAE